MKVWASSESDVLCGYCGTLIKGGTRFGVLESGDMRKVRCASCFKAYGPPEDTGDVAGPVQVKASQDMQRLSAIAPTVLAFDPKMRQVGRDE